MDEQDIQDDKAVSNVAVHIEKIRGMRVDFGEYYGGMWSGKSSCLFRHPRMLIA